MTSAASERPPRDPLAEQRIDDDVAVAFAGEDVFAHERGERRLDASRCRPGDNARGRRRDSSSRPSSSTAARSAPRCASVSRCHVAFEERLVLAEQPLQRRVQIVEARRLPPLAAHVVPDLVREPLHVVGQVAGELDDRRAEARRRPDAARLEARLDERRRSDRPESSGAASPGRPCRTAGCGRASAPSGSARIRRRRSRPGADAAPRRAARARRCRR